MLLAEAGGNSLDVVTILMGLLGGLALFLYGMEQMSEALKRVAGNGMRRLLAWLTTNRFTGAIAGALVTAVIQSSSVTTVLVVGFVSAGMISLSQSIGVILGANVGTTITAQIIAFKITHYSLFLVAGGFALLFCFKNEKVRTYGSMLMGLGLVFFGMELMSTGTRPLRSFEPFIDLMRNMDNPLLAILASGIFTALVQSSSATTGLVIVLAGQGFITLDTGIALIFGANVGTCVTAMLAAIGKPREAVRSALVHLIFNVGGVCLWYAFIPQLSSLVTMISPAASDALGTATPRQIANAHAVFNVSNTLLFIWFTTPFAWLVSRLVPEQHGVERPCAEPRYLNDYVLKTPPLAVEFARLELGRLGKIVIAMVHRAMSVVIEGTRVDLDRLERQDDDVDALYAEIVTYLGQLAKENLTGEQSEHLHRYLAAANHLESIGDMIETNLVNAGRERLRLDLTISTGTEAVLEALDRRVSWSVGRAIDALVDNDRRFAEEVTHSKSEFNRLCGDAEKHLSQRLSADEPNRLAAFRLESEILEYLKRMYYFAKRIAKLVDGSDVSGSIAETV
jgi:phosphate:Na+ symporter